MNKTQVITADRPGNQVFLRVSDQPGDSGAAIRVGNDERFVITTVQRQELDMGIVRYLVCVPGAWERIMEHELICEERKKRREESTCM